SDVKRRCWWTKPRNKEETVSSFFGINLASGALKSFQRAMDVTGHNLANVNTPGYSRQTIDFQSNGDFTFWDHGVNNLGQGVTTGQVQRI
ncbi:flagellar basal body protein, partial [Acinetobacter baumannii]